MLCVLPFHNGDKEIAILLAEWIRDLGGVSGHECMLVVPRESTTDGVLEPLQAAFGKVYQMAVNDPDPHHWPESANLMFRRAARQIEAVSPQPFLWLEPDAIPLSPTWLDQLAAEYAAVSAKNPFLGVRVELPGILPHMSGVAVYPGKASSIAPLLVTCNKVAFDVNGARQTLPRMWHTDLIQHEWKPAEFETPEDLNRINSRAVIYHQSKTGGLIRLLRSETIAPEIHDPFSAVLRAPSRVLAENEGDSQAKSFFTIEQLSEDPNEAVQTLVNGLGFIARLGERQREIVVNNIIAAGLGYA